MTYTPPELTTPSLIGTPIVNKNPTIHAIDFL